MEEKEFIELIKHSWLRKMLARILIIESIWKKIKFSFRTTCISLINEIIAHFTKKKDKIKKKLQEDEEFYDLCAVDNEEDKKCGELLKWGLENKKVNNIAVTGPYGAGKTSFLRSFENNHKEYKYLNVSLASFKEDENNEKTIEENILQQILYKVNGNKMPYSRIKRIKELNFKDFLFYSFSLYVWLNVLYGVFLNSKFKSFKELFLIEIPEDKKYLYLPFIFLSVLLIFQALSFFKSFNIKIKAFDSEFQLSNNDEASVFYMYLDEIIYFFKKTKYDVVYFEDIDRFEKINLDLFTKLRELNGLLNQSEDIKRPINFVYAVKDDLFVEKWAEGKKSTEQNKNSDKLRTKFFDLIIPIIPVINVSNSSDILCKKLKKIIIEERHEELIRRVNDFSLYIDDMRLLNNIYNEFVVYRSNLEDKKATEQIDDIKLLGFMVYKNKYPKDFSELHFNEGKVFDVFKRKTEILNSITNKLNNELKELENLIEKCSSEKLDNLEDLRMKTLNYLMKLYPFAIRFANQSIANLINNEGDFLTVINAISLNYISHDGSSMSRDNCKTEHLPVNKKIGFSYEERKQLIERKIANEIITLKNKYTDLRLEIDNINKKSLRDLISQYGLDIIKTDKNENDDLILYLIKEGIIDEKTYHLFISYFYEGNLTNLDRELLISIKNEKELPYDFSSDHIKEVIERLYVENFNKKYILNYSLVEYILINNEKYRSEFKTLIKFMIEDLENLEEYLNGFFVNIVNSSKILKILVKEIKILFKVICINPDTYEIKSKKNILDILTYGDINDIAELNIDDTVSNFLYNSEYSFSLLKEFSEINLSKFKELLKRLNIKLKYLNPTEDSEAFDYIYKNNLYDISIDNIENIAKVVCEDSKVVISSLREKNYTTIKSIDTLKPLYNYTADKFLNYIEDIFLEIATNINEDEKAILEILNADDEILNLEAKKKVIEKQECVYTDISKIDNKELWENVFDKFKIQATWENVLHYFVHKEENIDDVLLKCFNNIEFSEELSKIELSNINGFKDNKSNMSRAIKESNDISIISFSIILSSLYVTSNISNIPEDKIDVIMNKDKFYLKSELIEGIKKSYPEKKLELFERNIRPLIEKFEELREFLDSDDYKCLFNSTNITKEIKLEILNKLDVLSVKKSTELYLSLQKYLEDTSILPKIENSLFINLNTVNLLPIVEVVIAKLREIDEVEEMKELNKFIENNYTSILKKLNKLEFTEIEYLFLFEKLETFEEQKLFLNSFDISKLSENSELVTKLVKFIVDSENEKIDLDFEKLILIIKNTSQETSKIKLLISQLEFLNNANIKNILRKLNIPYSLLISSRQVSIEITEINELLLRELEKKEIVSSYKKNEEDFIVYVKKSFLNLSIDL